MLGCRVHVCVCYARRCRGGLKKKGNRSKEPLGTAERKVLSEWGQRRGLRGSANRRCVPVCVCGGCLVTEKGVVGVRGAEMDCRYGGRGWEKEQKVADERVSRQVKEMEKEIDDT